MNASERLARAAPHPPSNYHGFSFQILDSANVAIHVETQLMVERLGRRQPTTLDALHRRLVSAAAQSSPVTVRGRPWATTRLHVEALVTISDALLQLSSPGGPLDITLAYALPLALDPEWRRWAVAHADEIAEANQLVVVPATELVAVRPCKTMSHARRRLFARHVSTEVRETRNTSWFMDYWATYCGLRFGSVPSPKHVELLRLLLDDFGVTIREFRIDDRLFGACAVLVHSSGAVFDMLAAWDESAQRLRPGIFMGVHNLWEAAQQQAPAYSLCYGTAAYKMEIVRGCPILDLPEIAHAVPACRGPKMSELP